MLGGKLTGIIAPIAILSAIPLSLATPQTARLAIEFVPAALVIMMTFSTAEIQFRHLIQLREMWRRVLISTAINLLILTPIILAVANLMPDLDPSHLLGFSIMAASPPAIAVVGYTKILGGDVKLALLSNMLSYLLALLYTPILMALLLGNAQAATLNILFALALYIIVPMLLSRLLPRARGSQTLTAPIVIGMGVVIVYATTGSALQASFPTITELLEIGLVGLSRTFLSGIILFYSSILARAPVERAIVYSLFGSQKNLGLAAAIVLQLSGPESLLPIALCIPLEALFFATLLSIRARVMIASPNSEVKG